MALGWQRDRDLVERVEECIAVLDEKGREHRGCLRDRHLGRLVGGHASRPMIEQHGREGARSNRFPEIPLEA
jgi:hypothetical protein